MPTLDELLSGQAPPQPGEPAPPAGEQPSALDAILAAYGGPEPAGPALTPALPSESPQTALNPAQQAAMQRDQAAEIRPQSFWERFAGGVPRAWTQAALSGIQGIPALGALVGSKAIQAQEAVERPVRELLPEPVERGLEAVTAPKRRLGEILADYASEHAETEQARQWQLGQAMRPLGPVPTGVARATAYVPEVLAAPVVGVAGTGAKALGRTVAGTARHAGLKKAPSVPGFARAKDFLSRWLTSSRGLSPETVAAIESRESNVAAARIAAKAEARGLDRMIGEHVAKNPGTDEAALRDSVAAILAGYPSDATVKVPGRISFLAKSMRKEVDSLSKILIDEGAVDKGLADVFEDNLGSYLTRSYRAFDDPIHIDKLKASGQWDELKVELRKMPELAGTPDDALEGWMESIAKREVDALGTGGGVGTIEASIYRARKSVPKPIRDLLGEYKDPAIQYYKTAERLSRNVNTHRMYSALRDIGVREGWLSETPRAGISRVLAGEGTTRTPVGGMFTSDEMKAVIEGTQRAAQGGFWRRLSGVAKEAKTVGSVQAQARNAESNLLILQANGNLGTKFMPWGKAGKDLGLVRALRDLDLANGKRVMRAVDELDLPAVDNLKASDLRGAWDEARRFGVVDSQIDIGDIKAMLGEADAGLSVEAGGRLRRGLRKTRAGFRAAYQAGDAVPKLSAWRSERAKLRWARPDLSDVEVKARAAEIVKNTMPTYSRVPQAIEKVRQAPFIGPFVSWAAEIPRVAKNTTMTGLREIREGARMGNKRLVTLGVHRLASQASAFSFPQAAKGFVRAVREGEPDWQTEWDAAPLLPPWMEQGQYVLAGVDGENMTVVDLSFGDPWAVLKDAVIASIKTGEVNPTMFDRAGEAFKSLAEPYANPDIATGAIVDVWRGQRAGSGRSLFAPDDPLSVKAYRAATHLGPAFLPGTVGSLQKIGKGVLGTADRYGNVRDPAIETLALLGPRIYKINIPRALGFEARSFAATKAQASWNESVADSGNRAQQAIEGYSGAALRRRSTERLVLAAHAASRAGLAGGRISRALADGGLSKADTRGLMAGLYAYESGPDAWRTWLDRYVNTSASDARARREKQ